jgi:hypothetical protein
MEKYDPGEIGSLVSVEGSKQTFRQRFQERRERLSRLYEVSAGWYSPYLMATQRVSALFQVLDPGY